MNGKELQAAREIVKLPSHGRRRVRYRKIKRALDLIARETDGLPRLLESLEEHTR